jgi:hypothetical protein
MTTVLLVAALAAALTATIATAAPQLPLLGLRNITYSCNSSTWGPAYTYCVNSLAAHYLTLPGEHYAHDVDWERFPEVCRRHFFCSFVGGSAAIWPVEIYHVPLPGP